MVTGDPVKTLVAEAAALQARGDNAGALQILAAGHNDYPADVQILLNIGQIYGGIGDYANAAVALQRADQLAPESPAILVPYSKALSQTGKVEEALAMCETGLNLEPDSIPALENASEILFKAGRLLGVVKCLELLSALRPGEMRYLSDLSLFYEKTHQFEEAYNTYRKLWDDNLATAFDYARMGAYAFLSHKISEAIPYLEKAVAMEPGNAHSWMFLGRCHAVQGDKEAAREALQKSIAANPHFINSYFFLTEIEPFEKGDPAFATLEGLKTDGNLSVDDRGALGFALGRMYHGVGDYDKAFENFEMGNASTKEQFASLGYLPEPEKLIEAHRLMTALFSPENRKKLEYRGSKSTKPVFIVGMPRSGTTLLEQIMSAHSEISSAGELRDMILIHRDMLTRAGALTGPALEAALLSLLDEEGESYAASYLDKLEQEGDATATIIDKLPQNFEQLGLINVLFPNARIIHIRRDPMDVGLSIFCNQFSIDWRYFQGLGDIGYYIRQYRDLMTAWESIIDLPIHQVDYQELAENPEKVARGVIEFCGHEWQPECLDFHKKRSEVHTASVMQVRNPVNKSAVGKWRTYEKYLGPLQEALEG